jgi:hypothetical protein
MQLILLIAEGSGSLSIEFLQARMAWPGGPTGFPFPAREGTNPIRQATGLFARLAIVSDGWWHAWYRFPRIHMHA